MQAQHGPRLAADRVLVVGVGQEGEHRAPDAGGRLDHVRDVAAPVGLDHLDGLAAGRRVGGEVEVTAVGDALELGPLDVGKKYSTSAVPLE